jgi:hypothetical protein
MLAFLCSLMAVLVAATFLDGRRSDASRIRQTSHGFAVLDVLVVGLLLSITAAVLVLAITNIRSV